MGGDFDNLEEGPKQMLGERYKVLDVKGARKKLEGFSSETSSFSQYYSVAKRRRSTKYVLDKTM